jgi:hypothetical protein
MYSSVEIACTLTRVASLPLFLFSSARRAALGPEPEAADHAREKRKHPLT